MQRYLSSASTVDDISHSTTLHPLNTLVNCLLSLAEPGETVDSPVALNEPMSLVLTLCSMQKLGMVSAENSKRLTWLLMVLVVILMEKFEYFFVLHAQEGINVMFIQKSTLKISHALREHDILHDLRWLGQINNRTGILLEAYIFFLWILVVDLWTNLHCVILS